MGKKPKKPIPLHADQTVGDAFRTVLRHNFDFLPQWEDAARSWDDIEGVHQIRVSFRRMRSALSIFRAAVPQEATAEWAEEMRWLGNQLGMARDLDVFIDEGLGAIRGKLPLAGEEQMMALAERHRAAAYETVRAMLDGTRYARFKGEFPQWLADEAWLTEELKDKHRKRLKSPVVPFSRKLLDAQERQVLSTGSHVNPGAAEEMHRLRIRCKKLRYAAEFFTPIFAGMDAFIGHMKGLQDLLGVMNDVSVMTHLLDTLLEGETDVGVLQYAGGLVGWRTRQFHEIRDSFDARWKEFVEAKHPWWTKSAVIY